MSSGLTCDAPAGRWCSAASPACVAASHGTTRGTRVSGSFQLSAETEGGRRAASLARVSLRESPVNAVPQACAKSVLNGGWVPRAARRARW